MKKNFKDWKLHELILLIFSIVAVTLVFVLSNEKSIISYIASLIGITSVMMCAKGLFYAPFLDFIYISLYIIMSINEKYYGEVFVYIFIMIPLTVCTIITWLKKRNGNSNIVEVNNIKKKEWIILLCFSIIIPFLLYFVLKALNTSQLIISTISIFTSIIASYLLLRRSSYYAIAYILNDLVLILLWSLTIFNGSTQYLPLVVSLTVYLINDCYGFYRWRKQEKKQKKELAQ